jgi:hypothetical protein
MNILTRLFSQSTLKAKEKSTSIRTNFMKTRNQLIKKSNSLENDLKEAPPTAVSLQVSKNEPPRNEEKSGPPRTPKTYQSDTSRNSFSASSGSSHSSISNNEESIKEAIRRTADEFNTNVNRFTIDLSNDPDIKKYFEANNDEDDEENDDQDEEEEDDDNRDTDRDEKTLKEMAASVNLIDISDDVKPANSTVLSIAGAGGNVHNDSTSSSLSTVSSLSFNSANNNNNNNTAASILNPLKPTTTKSGQNDNSYESIINEFDPFSDANIKKAPPTPQLPLVQTSYQNNLANLTPRPFQIPTSTSQFQFRPNYNINLPLLASSSAATNVKSMSNSVSFGQMNAPLTMSQSLNTIAKSQFTATPFYNTNVSQAYRPVHFNNSHLPNHQQQPLQQPQKPQQQQQPQQKPNLDQKNVFGYPRN